MKRVLAFLLLIALAVHPGIAVAAGDPVPTLEDARTIWIINTERAKAGAPPVSYDFRLARAARAHAQFLAQNFEDYLRLSLPLHIEPEDWRSRPGWTGKDWLVRAKAQGYRGNVGEVLSTQCSLNRILVNAGWQTIQNLMNTIWHRIALIEPQTYDAGSGMGTGVCNPYDERLDVGVVDLGIMPRRYVDESYVLYYPPDGATDVPLRFEGEHPNPLWGTGLEEASYPVTVTVYEKNFYVANIDVQEASIIEEGTGPIPILIFDESYRYEFMENSAALMAKRPFKPGKRYEVRMKGILKSSLPDRAPKPFEYRWSFRTASRDLRTWTAGSWRFVQIPIEDGLSGFFTDYREWDKAAKIGDRLLILPNGSRTEVYARNTLKPIRDTKPPFSDVGQAIWAAPSIYAMWAMGWMQGRGGHRFAPGDRITEAEAAVALHRMAGYPPGNGPVPEGTPAKMVDALRWATDSLAPSETIAPNRPISRARLVAWTVRTMLAGSGVELPDQNPGFADDAELPELYKAEIAWARKVGIVKGFDGGRLGGNDPVTRAQAAVLWCRAFVGVGCDAR